jgi:hypothetical protein
MSPRRYEITDFEWSITLRAAITSRGAWANIKPICRTG